MTMNEQKTEFLKGTLDMLILKVVALGPVHGYAISQRIQQISQDVFTVNQGSLYPALHRLEKGGWIKAEWGTSENNRKARYYRLTSAGKKHLAEETEHWKMLSAAIGRIITES